MACASSPQTSLCKEEEEEKDIRSLFDSYAEKFMKQKGSSFSKNNLKVERERVIMVVVVMMK